jgi:hypothetical protein
MATSYANTGQFDLARKRAEQRANAEQQQQDDALKRRFAAMGGLNSGAYIKQQSVQADDAAKRRADVMEGIDVAESNEAQRQREVQEGREFARSERLGSQDFSASQADLQRKYQTGERLGAQDFSKSERLGGQDFASGESALARLFAQRERESSQEWQGGQNELNRLLQSRGLDLQQRQIDNQADQFLKDFDQRKFEFSKQVENWQQQIGLEKQAQTFNQWLSIFELNSGKGAFQKDIYNPYTRAVFGRDDIRV